MRVRLQYSTEQFSAALQSAVQYSTEQFSAVVQSSVEYSVDPWGEGRLTTQGRNYMVSQKQVKTGPQQPVAWAQYTARVVSLLLPLNIFALHFRLDIGLGCSISDNRTPIRGHKCFNPLPLFELAQYCCLVSLREYTKDTAVKSHTLAASFIF